MRITGIAPNWIYQHNNATGDNVVAEVQITNSPQSISVSSAACRIEDCLENLLPCSATCTVSCAQQASTNPSIYNSTCAMNFRITSGYDQRKNYTVIPIISYGISYKNASGADIIGSFDAQSSINIGSHWMGDGKCDADESNATTCFDCPCSSDYYCDTQNANRHTAGDACRLKSSLTATIGQLSQSAFGDAANLHATDIRVQVNGIPNSASFTPSCRFGGGGVGCGVTCSAPNSTGGMFCNFTIAAIDYRNSQFYDSVSKTLTVPNNTFTLNVSFRDGKKTASKGFSFALADISMEPNFHAANGDCEEELGENFENSCVDCGCGSQTEYCYITIDNFVGQCIDSSQLRLAVTATNPVMPNCTINFYKEECQFIMPTEIYASIPNAPNDLRLIDYKLSFGNESVDPACMAFPTNQNQRYSCSFVIPSVEGDNGGKINKSFSLNFTVRYSTNGTVRTQSLISDVSSFTINRIKSDRVMQCEQAMSDLSSKQKKLDQDNTMLMVFLGIAGAIAVTTCTLMGLCCIPANPTCAFGFSCGLWLFLCGLAIAIVGCIGDILMQSVDQIEQEVKQLEAQKKSLCAGSDASSMRSALDSMGDAGMSMGSIGMKILCAIGMIVMMFGAMQMMSAAPAASGAGAGAGSTTPGVIAAPLAPPPPPPAPVIL
jgi:hypothetical protein